MKKKRAKKTDPKEKAKTANTGAYLVTQEVLGYVDDAMYGEPLEVRNTANGWWKDNMPKVEKLGDAYKIGLNNEEVYLFVGITHKQYRYFMAMHPHFSPYFEQCKNNPKVKTKVTIYQNLHDPKIATWYAEKKMSNEFKNTVTFDNPIARLTPEEGKSILENALNDLKSDDNS